MRATSGALYAILLTISLVSVGCSDDTASGARSGGSDTGRNAPGDASGGADTDTPTGCESDEECGAGRICETLTKICVPKCTTDVECGPAKQCDTQSGRCNDRAPCATRDDCGGSETCDICLGVCVPSTGGAACQEDVNCPDFDQFCDDCRKECRRSLELCEPCNDDRSCGDEDDLCLDFASGGTFCGVACGEGRAPCPAGSICSEEVSQCLPITGSCEARTECEGDAECSGLQVCSDQGICVDGCTEDEACPGTDVCVGGRCEPPCTTDAECEGEATCEDGRCRVPGGCITSVDCFEPETYCDRSVGMCVPGCEVETDCVSATLECVDGDCVPRGCRGAYSCAFGQVCDLESGGCQDAEGPYCDTCNGDDPDSCGTENLCANLQDEDGNDLGAFCLVACSDDPDNRCPQGYQCRELEMEDSSGATEVRELCIRSCDRDPV